MERKQFAESKEQLLQFIDSCIEKGVDGDTIALRKLLNILNQYSFENRLEKKGAVTRMIIDCLELEYSIGEKFIKFDESIN